MINKSDKILLHKMPNSKFQWENSFQCQMINTPFEMSRTKEFKFIIREPWRIVGYTTSSRNAREGSELGVMFEDSQTFDELWCHSSLDLLLQIGYTFDFKSIPEKIKKDSFYYQDIIRKDSKSND